MTRSTLSSQGDSKVKSNYPIMLTVTGAILAAVFAALSMSTGMWGCGFICRWFIAAFWLAVGVLAYGMWLAYRNKKNSRNA